MKKIRKIRILDLWYRHPVCDGWE